MFKWYYNVSWALQLAVGLVLFGVTAVLETVVLAAYLGSLWLAVCIAAGLEAGKVLAVVLYRLLNGQVEVPYPRGVRWMTIGFRSLLLGLSAACSLMFLALHLDRPALEQVRAADLAAAETHYREDLARVQAGYVERRDRLLARFAEQERREHAVLEQRYLARIAALESQLDAEMNRVVGGEFKGKRYKEIESRLAAEKDGYTQALAALDKAVLERPAALIERLEEERRTREAELTARRTAGLAAIRSNDYQGDVRVEHPMARAFVNLLGAIFTHPPTTLQFAFWFALFLSLTMELGIWVAFEHLTLARLPVFTAGHRAELFVAGKEVETDSALRGFAIEDELIRAKVRHKQRGIAELLREAANEKLSEDGHPSHTVAK
jgi:hypothetical protein